MDNYVFNPGPIDDSVLYDQANHVSSAVWEGQERGVLTCHGRTLMLDSWVLTAQQTDLVERAGFGHLRHITSFNIDQPLICALVERWRRETNTFHLPVGEMTVTLEDVALLLGLSVAGEPVTGEMHSSQDSICAEYLGKSPGSKGGMVKLKWLKQEFSVCPVDASFQDIVFHTRAYLLYLVGTTIFPNCSYSVAVMYLPLFKNFDEAGKYAWGAAALCWLYRALGNASLRSTTSNISGCLTLLQCWSYYHLRIGRPNIDQSLTDQRFPLILRWKHNTRWDSSNLCTILHLFRNDLNRLTQVNWSPYAAHISHDVVPENIKNQIILGRSKTMLICFNKSERHLPDRCLRQFGMMHQRIPQQVQNWERVTCESDLNEWQNRHLNIVELAGAKVDGDEYMRWYWRITRRFVGKAPHASQSHTLGIMDDDQGQSSTTNSNDAHNVPFIFF